MQVKKNIISCSLQLKNHIIVSERYIYAIFILILVLLGIFFIFFRININKKFSKPELGTCCV